MIHFDLSADAFRAQYFEQKPLHLPGALSARPIAWSDIDRLLHVMDPQEPSVRIFQHGQISQDAYLEEFSEAGQIRHRLNKVKFYDLMGRGATLQINWLERHLIEAKRLCLEVGRFARAQTSGNAYMSFTGDGSFGQHWDTHDVFVIQLIGRKRWLIYEPTFALPLTLQTNDRSGQTCPAEPAIELILEEGDLMYIPRGWWHHVIPLQVGSFHLSVGCYLPTVFDYIVQMSAKYLEQELGARRAFDASDFAGNVSALMQGLPAALLDPEKAKAFERDWVERERLSSEFTLAALASSNYLLSPGARLSLTTFSAPDLGNGTLHVNGRNLRLEPLNQTIVALLGDAGAMSFGALREHLAGTPEDTLRGAVLDLARYEIVTIAQ